jgi:hypothetical protein
VAAAALKHVRIAPKKVSGQNASSERMAEDIFVRITSHTLFD